MFAASGWKFAAVTAEDEQRGRSKIGDILCPKLRRYIVGGEVEVDNRRCEVHEMAKTDGGDGWLSDGSSILDCVIEKDWTEFRRLVVKNRFFDDFPAYCSSRTWPCYFVRYV